MTLFDENGKEVEGALTPEEAEERIKEAQEQAKEEVQSELTPLQEELKEKEEALAQATAELEKSKDKGTNIKNLRDKADKVEVLEKAVEELKTKSETLEKTLTEKEVKAQEAEVGKMIKDIAGGDDKLAEKVKFHYSTFNKATETQENRAERIQNAAKLAGIGQAISGGSSAISSGGGRAAYSKPDTKLNEEQKELGAKLGLKPEELK
jgi:DNA repair exonuclease SbcCD ATPase subunit